MENNIIEEENSKEKINLLKEDSFSEKIKELSEKGINRLTYNSSFVFLIFLPIFISNFYFTLLSIISIIILIILRFINLGRSGWYVLGFLVPLYRIYLFFILIFSEKSEAKGDNIFIKILVGIFVFTFLAILSTIAFISFQGYMDSAEKERIENISIEK